MLLTTGMKKKKQMTKFENLGKSLKKQRNNRRRVVTTADVLEVPHGDVENVAERVSEAKDHYGAGETEKGEKALTDAHQHIGAWLGKEEKDNVLQEITAVKEKKEKKEQDKIKQELL